MFLRLNEVDRLGTTDYELLTKAILTHWKAPEIDWEKVVLNRLNSVHFLLNHFWNGSPH